MKIRAWAILCLSLLAGGCSTSAPPERPNILFIAIDDMNDWTTLFDPSNPINTPNLERLAQRGTFFTRAYCAAPGCNPSRTAIMTGLRPASSGVYGNRDPWRKMLPDAVTLPQYFIEHGYAAEGAGKIFHHGPSGADDPSGPSFQNFFKMLPTRAPEHNYDGQSLVPLLRNPEAIREQPAVMTWGRGNHAVRTERWRYIRYHDGSQELYDHRNDPWEWRNLAGDPRYAAVITEHQRWLPNDQEQPSAKMGASVRDSRRKGAPSFPPGSKTGSPHYGDTLFGAGCPKPSARS